MALVEWIGCLDNRISTIFLVEWCVRRVSWVNWLFIFRLILRDFLVFWLKWSKSFELATVPQHFRRDPRRTMVNMWISRWTSLSIWVFYWFLHWWTMVDNNTQGDGLDRFSAVKLRFATRHFRTLQTEQSGVDWTTFTKKNPGPPYRLIKLLSTHDHSV